MRGRSVWLPLALVAVLASHVDRPAVAAAAVSLRPSARRALDDLLRCERPEGGWTYVCPPRGPYGAVTWPLVRALAIARPLGLADWDVAVLRSPGTPAAGLALVEGYRRSGDPRYLAAARRTGDLLLALQLASGGWFSEVPVHGTRPARWFSAIAHWDTLDDDVTPGAIRMLLALSQATGEARYRDAAGRGLDVLVGAQLPSGAWPLTARASWRRRLVPSFEDLASTNDAATAAPIQALLAGAHLLGRPELLAAAHRGGQWLVAVQGADPQAGWAQQYDADGRPAGGRRFEVAALASWETREMVDALLALTRETGDGAFCAPAARALRWLVHSALRPGCWSRYYTVGTNAPLYIGPDGRPVATPAEARRPYRWTGDYGIPGLLAALGRPVTPSAPPRRIPGDAGDCPGEERHGDGPRGRIARAARLLGVMAGAPPPGCAAEIRRALAAPAT